MASYSTLSQSLGNDPSLQRALQLKLQHTQGGDGKPLYQGAIDSDAGTQTTKALQTYLQEHGYYKPGITKEQAADGIVGQDTQSAIRNWLNDNGAKLLATGPVDKNMIDAMRERMNEEGFNKPDAPIHHNSRQGYGALKAPSQAVGPDGKDQTMYYVQKTGQFWLNGKPVGDGHSGLSVDGARDNPDKESLRNVGMIPRGEYSIGRMQNFDDTTSIGSKAISLTPIPGTGEDGHGGVYGRDGFYIHRPRSGGDGSTNGCISADENTRERIAQSGATRLHVVKSNDDMQMAMAKDTFGHSEIDASSSSPQHTEAGKPSLSNHADSSPIRPGGRGFSPTPGGSPGLSTLLPT